MLFGQTLNVPFTGAAGADTALRELGSALLGFVHNGLQYVPLGPVVLALAGLALAALAPPRQDDGGRRGGLAGPLTALLAVLGSFALYAAVWPWSGEQPGIAVPEDHHGLVLVLPVAVLVGYGIGRVSTWLSRASLRAPVAVLCLAALTLLSGVWLTRHSAGEHPPSVVLAATGAPDQRTVSTAFKAEYDGGDVLLDTAGNETIAFPPQLADALVHQGVNRNDRWRRSLADPAAMGIRWIVMRCAAGRADTVCHTFDRDPTRLAAYEPRYIHPGESAHRIYRLREPR